MLFDSQKEHFSCIRKTIRSRYESRVRTSLHSESYNYKDVVVDTFLPFFWFRIGSVT